MNIRQERFCEFVASGMTGTEAYLQAGWRCNRDAARASAAETLAKPSIKARIAEIRAKDSQKSEYKRADMVRFLVAVLQTPVGEIDANSPLAQEVTTDTIGEATIRKRVKMMGKIESARLLVEMMGWKAPEHRVVETGPKTLAGVKERMERVASALNLRAHLQAKAQAANANGYSNGSALSRWPGHTPNPPALPVAGR